MKFLSAIILMVCLPVAAETYSSKTTHVLGEHESKETGRAACIESAQAAVMENLGSLLQSKTTIVTTEHDGRVSEEATRRVESFLSTMSRAKLEGEYWEMTGDRLSITCNVAVTFDPEELRRDLEQKRAEGLSRGIEATAKGLDALSRRARQARIGMTKAEVLDLIGPPVGKSDSRWQYGQTVIRFGILSGTVDRIEDIWGN